MSRTYLLFLNVFVIATCGLVYELIAGTLASYVLGDSVTQFSTCIGVYLFALGGGAWLSGFVQNRLARRFVEIELAVALIGGFSAPILFLSFAVSDAFQVMLYGLVLLIGLLVGLELPLLMRILRTDLDFKDLVSRVLTFDYVGALVGALAFPLLLVPSLGLVRTSLLFGMLNALVGLWGTWLLRTRIAGSVVPLRARALLVLGLLVAGLVQADWFTTWSEERLFSQPVVYAETSRYQRIVVTGGPVGFQLYLNGNLQFSSLDEYRYHESLVHPAMSTGHGARRVLILGGGDGLALREVLKYPDVQTVTLVDLDPAMTALSERFAPLGELNGHALKDSRVEVVNQDAMIWLETAHRPYDVIVIDFPDPNNFALGKLYTSCFFRMLQTHLAPGGAVAIQCTSPLYSRKSYWCIVHTMRAAGWHVHPYHVPVPSFGVWGFALARRQPFEPPTACRPGLRFLDSNVLPGLFQFPPDLQPVETEVNRLDNQILVQYYHEAWADSS
jgi:spermidine synthase